MTNPTENTPTVRTIGIRNVDFGINVTVIQPVNLYECAIGDDVFIGPFVEIQSMARIGARTRVQSHSFICSLVTIGDDCFVGHGVMFINDDFKQGFPARHQSDLWLRTTIADHVTIGSNVTILPVSICSHVVIGAGAVVTQDIIEPGFYCGVPAVKIR